MRILLCFHLFHPSVGGTEQVGQALATEFSLAGHTVKVVTSTGESGSAIFLFEVIRRPSLLELFRLVLWSEVVFHNNISLRLYWPLAFVRRPIVAGAGGLLEAIGELAVMFDRENPVSLARAIERALTEEFDWERYWQLSEQKLHCFAARAVAAKYLDVLTEAVCEKGLQN